MNDTSGKGPASVRKVLVTGASSGIGQGIAIAFGRLKAEVIVNYHGDKAGAERTVEEITKAGGKGELHQADVSNEREVEAMFDHVVKNHGWIDVLINNAGIQRDAAFAEMSLADWNKVIAVNLTGQFLCSREAIKVFRGRENVDRSKAIGHIIFISSVHDVIPWSGHANYAASKGGQISFTKSLAPELASFGINVNCVAPGWVLTDMTAKDLADDTVQESITKTIPLGRAATPEEIAGPIVFLCSEWANHVTGEVLNVNGGSVLCG